MFEIWCLQLILKLERCNVLKLGESHQRKLSCTSLPQNASPSFYVALISVHLPRPNCTHSTSLLLVSWWSCLIHLDCCRYFGFKLPSELLERRFKKFMSKRIWPCTRLLYDTLCTHSIIVGFMIVFVFFCLYIFYVHDLPMHWWIKLYI